MIPYGCSGFSYRVTFKSLDWTQLLINQSQIYRNKEEYDTHVKNKQIQEKNIIDQYMFM